MSSATVLLVDDQQSMLNMLVDALALRQISCKTATSANQALKLLKETEPDVVLTDLRMPQMDGIELCRTIAQQRPDIPVIVMTAFGNLETSIEAIRAGAFDFVTKPVELDLLHVALHRAVEQRRLKKEIKRLEQRSASPSFGQMLGDSPAMQRLYGQLRRIANSSISVLITGESGTGKELVAYGLHEAAAGKDQSFVAVNCAALPESLLESELFGHVKGAFTDAREDRTGLIAQANGGTLFLDEIGEMPIGMQPKLLRVLEQKTFRPVGGTQDIPYNARLITATNRDLAALIEDRQFREDLYYRINVAELKVPPLRARGMDVLLLANHFVSLFAQEHGKAVVGIAEPAAEKLLRYDWPGNVRELRNVMEQAVVLTEFDKILVDDLPYNIVQHQPSRLVIEGADSEHLLSLDELQNRYIRHVLESVHGNRSEAARILGVDRKTLYRKLKVMEAEPDEPRS